MNKHPGKKEYNKSFKKSKLVFSVYYSHHFAIRATQHCENCENDQSHSVGLHKKSLTITFFVACVLVLEVCLSPYTNI